MTSDEHQPASALPAIAAASAAAAMPEIATSIGSPPDDLHHRRGERRRWFVRAIVSGVGGKTVGLVVSVLSVSMVVRHLDQERYGLWSVIGSTVAFLVLGNFGLGA